jgi:hypothetical protein
MSAEKFSSTKEKIEFGIQHGLGLNANYEKYEIPINFISNENEQIAYTAVKRFVF